MTDMELAWLAGYLEGEGCFRIPGVGRCRRRPNAAGTPSIKVHATDADVVHRAGDLMGVSSRTATRTTTTGTPVYTAEVHGDKALAIMRTILPFMGNRRRARILEVLDLAAKRPGALYRGDARTDIKLRDADVAAILRRSHAGERQIALAREYHVSQALISLVVTGQRRAGTSVTA